MNHQPIVVAWGGGRDSTAFIIELHRLGVHIDAILIADVGSEKPETYHGALCSEARSLHNH